MLFSKSSKAIGSILMSAVLTNVPAIVMAEPGMIPTHIVATEMSRSQ